MLDINNTMEILDIVDKNDEVIGTAPRDEAYTKGLWHRIVHVLIFNDKNEMALQLRSDNVLFCPDHWSTAVGGCVSTGESYKIAAIREYEEELGTTSKLERFSKDYYEAGDMVKEFLVTFKTVFNGPFHQDTNVVKEIKFFTIDKIKEMVKNGEKFHPELLFLLEKYFF